MGRKEDIISAVFSMLIGVMLIVMKGQVVSIAITVFAVIVLISAVIDLFHKLTNSAIVKGVLGVCILIFGWVFVSVALYLLAAAIIIMGLLRLVNMHKFLPEDMTYEQKLFAYARPALTVLAGVCLLFNQGGAVNWVFILTGILLVAEGVLDVADALKSNKGQGGNALSIIDADDE
jgi:hypothetical protein